MNHTFLLSKDKIEEEEITSRSTGTTSNGTWWRQSRWWWWGCRRRKEVVHIHVMAGILIWCTDLFFPFTLRRWVQMIFFLFFFSSLPNVALYFCNWCTNVVSKRSLPCLRNVMVCVCRRGSFAFFLWWHQGFIIFRLSDVAQLGPRGSKMRVLA